MSRLNRLLFSFLCLLIFSISAFASKAKINSDDTNQNPIVIKGHMEGYNYPQLEEKISKTWNYILKKFKINGQVPPTIYFSPFVFAKEDPEWVKKQKSWITTHPEIWDDWNAISHGKPPVEEGNPFPDWFAAFQYYGTTLIQVNPFASFFPYYKYDAYGNLNDVAGLGYYSVGHELHHYALNLVNIPIKLHHCIFVLTPKDATKDYLMNQLADFLVNNQISSSLAYLRGSQVEEQLNPCEKLSDDEQKIAQKYLDSF